MTDRESQDKWSILSRSEELVLQALNKLPADYHVSSGQSLQVQSGEGSSVGRTYLPDFLIQQDAGQQVVVEVKSPQSLTMVNLSRFLAIDKQLREGGQKFMLLVPDAVTSQVAINKIDDFQDLHIYSVSDESEVINAVLSEFNASEPNKM